ncbi:hypothetical protein ACFL37_00005, partial [Candidatus Margulisiibacteriota bacterium]
SLPTGEVVNFLIKAEDLTGNAGLSTMLVAVANPDATPDGWDPPPPPDAYNPQESLASVLPKETIVDPESDQMSVQMLVKAGVSLSDFTVYVFNERGGLEAAPRRYVDGVGASGVTKKTVVTASGAVVTKFDIDYIRDDFAPVITPGLKLIRVTNNITGKTIAINKVMFVPASMKQ